MNLTRLLSIPVLGLAALVTNAHATPVKVQELGMGARESVWITSPTLNSGNPVDVWAGVVNLGINPNTPGAYQTSGFCIDPFHWSISGVQDYQMVQLADAPKAATSGGVAGMGTTTALKIEAIWNKYYQPSQSNWNQNAAGLQIAIWELVDASPAADGLTITFPDSAHDYGASGMVSWVNGADLSKVTKTSLVGVTGPGQDYAIPGSVPDGGSTGLLLGLGLAAIGFGVREKSRRRKTPARS